MSDLFDLDGSVALVTGGAAGIGFAIAEELTWAGARVAILDASPDAIARAVERFDRAGLDVLPLVGDAADTTALDSAVAAVAGWGGRLDIVVANAGVALDVGPHLETDHAALATMFELHVQGALRLANATFPHLHAAGGGAFIVTSSLAGLRGNRVLGSYGITKAAGAQLVRNLAVQWGPAGIRVNAVAPGVIDTDFAATMTRDPEVAAARLERTPLHRFGTAQEVAGTVVWLASRAGAFVTGQTIVVDGGTLIAD
jgi:NAD(P)-dependent dehydrogenase (short-subunit alcohol dehydrogenase family)